MNTTFTNSCTQSEICSTRAGLLILKKKKKTLLLDFRNLFLKRNLKECFPNIVTHSQKKKKILQLRKVLFTYFTK